MALLTVVPAIPKLAAVKLVFDVASCMARSNVALAVVADKPITPVSSGHIVGAVSPFVPKPIQSII